MTIDVFGALFEFSTFVTVHNVQLIDVQQSENGYESLTVECAGSRRQLQGGAMWNEGHSRLAIGKWGYIEQAPFSNELPAGACYFRDYIDQSLRRVYELDRLDNAISNDGHNPVAIGWCCDGFPNGFRAPLGVIPGEAGRFKPDESVSVTLRVPLEFVRECLRVQMTPEKLLRSFVGDLAGIQNYASCPRADRYCSNGSDERMYAASWLERAHGMNAIDIEALEERQQAQQEQEYDRDEISDMLDDYVRFGGKAEDLLQAVHALVQRQAEHT